MKAVGTGVLELTRELVALRTINPPGSEAAAADLLAVRLEAAGLSVDRHAFGEGRAQLVARLPGEDAERPALCLTGHLDTVPLGREPWTRDAFGRDRDGDRLYGRGTTDMKGGVAAIVVAAERVAALGRGAAGLELVICAGEETGCEGALALAHTEGALGSVGAMIVAEPTSNVPCVAHKGVAWFEARTSGRTAHGSMPQLGRNAIFPLARAVAGLESLVFDHPPHPLLGEPTLNLGRISGGININSVPDGATAGIDVRTVPGLDGEAVAAKLRGVLGDEVELTPIVVLPPVVSDPDDPWVVEVFDVIEPLIGERPAPRGLAYFTDAAALSPAYGTPPTVICGPGDPEQAHQTDESCSVARLEAAEEGFFQIARRWCGR